MRVGIGPGPAPELEGLKAYDAWATEHGYIVSRDYSWEWEDENGEVWPGFWYTNLTKEQRDVSGMIWVYTISVHDPDVTRGYVEAWENLAELLEAAFARMIENNVTLKEET